MTVTEDELLTDHGDRVTYGIVRKQPAVIVIPWDGKEFTLIGQYRYAVNFFSWEFPAGHHDHDTLKETAKAELEEEAGITAGKLEEIGTFHIAPGHSTQICHVFLATNLSAGMRNLEPSEKGMLIKKMTQTEIDEAIKRGTIKDGLTINAMMLLQLSLKKK